MKRRKRLEKGIESLRKQIELHEKKKEEALDEGREELEDYYKREIEAKKQDLEKKKKARFYFTGVAINLLNLRPEICTLLLIKDPNWIKNHGRAKKVNGYQLTKLNFNWEYKSGDRSTNISEGKGRIDLTADLVMPDNFKPEKFVPPAVAALKLGVDVAREELGFH